MDEHDIEDLRQIIEELRDAGGIGDCGDKPDLEWLNSVIAEMYDFCDANRVWIELDHEQATVEIAAP